MHWFQSCCRSSCSQVLKNFTGNSEGIHRNLQCLQLYWKIESVTLMSFLRNFSEQLFYRITPDGWFWTVSQPLFYNYLMLWVHCNHRFIAFFIIFSFDQLALVNGTCCDLFIHSNLRLAQSGKFAINPLYPGGGTIFVKIMDFRLFESLKRALSRAFYSPKLSRGS